METLSDKIYGEALTGDAVFHKDDVKEFIRSLPFFLILDEKQIKMLIKLAGDKLK